MVKFELGQIVFFNSNSLFAKIIRMYNRWNYGKKGWSHCGIITEVKQDRVMIHEAIGKGFVKTYYPNSWIENKMKENKIVIREVKKQYDLAGVKKNAEKYLGNEYAWKDIILIVIHWFTGFKFGGDSNSLICSEAVARILYDSSGKEINFAQEYDMPYDLITPVLVYDSIYLR